MVAKGIRTHPGGAPHLVSELHHAGGLELLHLVVGEVDADVFPGELRMFFDNGESFINTKA